MHPVPTEQYNMTHTMTSTLSILPVAAHASRRGVRIWPQPSETRGTVLIIEDDKLLLAAMSRRFRRAGIGVLLAADGTEGLRCALSGSADAVLLDLGLPGMRGFKLLHELRAREPYLPVIIVTGDLSPEIDRRAEDYGVITVFRKPFSTDLLIRTIEKLT